MSFDENGNAQIFFPAFNKTFSMTKKSNGLTEGEAANVLSFSVTYCLDGGQNTECLRNLDYEMNFSPSIRKYSAFPGFEGFGCYSIQDLGYNRRRKFSISGRAGIARCCSVEQAKFQLKTYINTLLFKYFNVQDRVLERDEITVSQDERELSFNFEWNGREI